MESGIVMRVHRVRSEMVVAACDAELVDRDLPVGASGRTVRITAYFYGERRVEREELLFHLRRATIVNLLGERVCRLAVEEGLLDAEGTGTLGGVPHAEIITVPEG
ncbi:MAG: DUF424 family protein [Thermoplasmata archaeon]|nr:DUF424 family protein [Thermoplasmata archaeon]MCI4338415.1 DUF424 family protein [Thermoplasmata archaeon]MCI4341895.1 DUF424 family protein [Thermoplasmata archaeon]